jgi:hypothetical protein
MSALNNVDQPFIPMISALHEELKALPVTERTGDDWRSLEIMLPPPSRADADFGLSIEEIDDEVTVGFDYSHVHLQWPPKPYDTLDRIWWDAASLVDAILSEKVVATSGWIDGELRIGCLRENNSPIDLILPKLQHIRTRSWLGTFNYDGPPPER